MVISGTLYLIFKSWGLAISCFIMGIFIDLDHFIDYIRENGWSFKIKNFFQVCHTCQFNRIFLLLHGWEWLILWGIAAWLTDWNPWMVGAFIGFSQHIVLDVFYNGSNLLPYSLIWRWKKDFHFDTIFSNLKSRKYKNAKYLSDEFKN